MSFRRSGKRACKYFSSTPHHYRSDPAKLNTHRNDKNNSNNNNVNNDNNTEGKKEEKDMQYNACVDPEYAEYERLVDRDSELIRYKYQRYMCTPKTSRTHKDGIKAQNNELKALTLHN